MVHRRAAPSPLRAEKSGAPAGQHSSLQAGPHLWTWIVPEMEFQWQLSASSLPALQLSESRSSLSLPASLVSQKPSICLQIILALSLGQNLSSRACPASLEAQTRWGSSKAAELVGVLLKVPEVF